MNYSESLQELLHITCQDEISAAVNLLSPFVGYLGCYAVTIATNCLDPTTALVSGIFMSFADCLCGSFATSYNKDAEAVRNSTFGLFTTTIIPAVAISATGTPVLTAVSYLVISVAARVFVSYQAATFWFPKEED